MKYLPDLDWGIVVFGNGNEGCNECIEVIAMTPIDELVGVPEAARLDWNQGRRVVFEKDRKSKMRKAMMIMMTSRV
jgi:hypothetical protein